MTLTASWQKVFSDNPKLGFFAQRDKFQDAIAAGQVTAPAKNMDQMHAVVTNSTVEFSGSRLRNTASHPDRFG